ncbi:hypothetical protein G8S21_00010 [Clostridium botulinum C]|nr:hypothetical protein [Clostridium botulinum]MCD3244327.1 hypothetical protein [Clostridium botulinum C]MCD3260885.1 hypothetical protein [Clostridium botulinum C]
MYNNLWQVIRNTHTIPNILPRLCNLSYKRHNKCTIINYIKQLLNLL